jgi:diketogulonate reductase-like aldo/keto reductase
MAEDASRRKDEIAALQLGIDLGLTLIDTAEMYANGGSEQLVGEAIEGRRDEVFLVTKVLPIHASLRGTIIACERSLKRLKTDRIDLYLLHWREETPIEETVAAFESLRQVGKIRSWGVSNFDLSDMEELVGLEDGQQVQTDQVLYNLSRRGIEYNLLPWCRQHGIPIMAYSPLEQGRVLNDACMRRIAARHDATPAQIALAWVLRQPKVLAIPKAGTAQHVRESHGALEVRLGQEDLDELDAAFPPPSAPRPLEMI